MKIYEKIHLFVQRNNNSEIKFDLVVKMIQVHRIDNSHASRNIFSFIT